LLAKPRKQANGPWLNLFESSCRPDAVPGMATRSYHSPEPSPMQDHDGPHGYFSPAQQALKGIPISRTKSTGASSLLNKPQQSDNSRRSSLDGTTFLSHATSPTESSSLSAPSSSGNNGQLEAKIVLLGSQGVGKTSRAFAFRSSQRATLSPI
jgi:hypothetical protein